MRAKGTFCVWNVSIGPCSVPFFYQYDWESSTYRGVGMRFFLGGGGRNVDMPSDCQNLGGGAQAYPSHWDKKLGGNCPEYIDQYIILYVLVCNELERTTLYQHSIYPISWPGEDETLQYTSLVWYIIVEVNIWIVLMFVHVLVHVVCRYPPALLHCWLPLPGDWASAPAWPATKAWWAASCQRNFWSSYSRSDWW